jgi:hypothetical protein
VGFLNALVDRHQHFEAADLDDRFQHLRLALSRFAATFALGD